MRLLSPSSVMHRTVRGTTIEAGKARGAHYMRRQWWTKNVIKRKVVTKVFVYFDLQFVLVWKCHKNIDIHTMKYTHKVKGLYVVNDTVLDKSEVHIVCYTLR